MITLFSEESDKSDKTTKHVFSTIRPDQECHADKKTSERNRTGYRKKQNRTLCIYSTKKEKKTKERNVENVIKKRRVWDCIMDEGHDRHIMRSAWKTKKEIYGAHTWLSDRSDIHWDFLQISALHHVLFARYSILKMHYLVTFFANECSFSSLTISREGNMEKSWNLEKISMNIRSATGPNISPINLFLFSIHFSWYVENSVKQI